MEHRNHGTWDFTETKSAKSDRQIPMPKSVVAMLVAHREKQADQQSKPPEGFVDLDRVFAGTRGQPLNLANLNKRHFKKILEEAELPSTLRLYDLRHSCATLLLAEGEHPKVVSERLGHASVTLTLDTYSHVLPTMQQQAADRLEEALFMTETDG